MPARLPTGCLFAAVLGAALGLTHPTAAKPPGLPIQEKIVCPERGTPDRLGQLAPVPPPPPAVTYLPEEEEQPEPPPGLRTFGHCVLLGIHPLAALLEPADLVDFDEEDGLPFLTLGDEEIDAGDPLWLVGMAGLAGPLTPVVLWQMTDDVVEEECIPPPTPEEKPVGRINDCSPQGYIRGLTPAGTFTPDLEVPVVEQLKVMPKPVEQIPVMPTPVGEPPARFAPQEVVPHFQPLGIITSFDHPGEPIRAPAPVEVDEPIPAPKEVPSGDGFTCPYLKEQAASKPAVGIPLEECSPLENLEKLERAEKAYRIGEHYRHTGHLGGAFFYYETARRLCPGSRVERMASERLYEMAHCGAPADTEAATEEQEPIPAPREDEESPQSAATPPARQQVAVTVIILEVPSLFIGDYVSVQSVKKEEREQFLRGIQQLRAAGLVRLVAEPRLVTHSGCPASFFSGGQFAVPVAAEPGKDAVRFEKVGTSLDILPTLTADGKVRLEVESEVSHLNSEVAVSIQGVTVPGRSTSRIHAMVELEPGETFVLGGLRSHCRTRLCGCRNNLLFLVTAEVGEPIAAPQCVLQTPEAESISAPRENEESWRPSPPFRSCLPCPQECFPAVANEPLTDAKKTQIAVGCLLQKFNELFKEGKYQEAEALAAAALTLDPENPVADAAVHMARMQLKRASAGPGERSQTGALIGAANAATMGARIGHATEKSDREEADNREPWPSNQIERKLGEKVSLNFDEAPLFQVIDDLRTYAGINVVLDRPALVEAMVCPDAKVSIKVDNVSLKTALDLILKQLKLSYVVKDEVVFVTPREQAGARLVLKCYPVADLITPEVQQKITVCAHEKEPVAAALIRLTIDTIQPLSWACNGGLGTIDYFPRTKALVVKQTPDVQEQVADLLDAVRRLRDSEPSPEPIHAPREADDVQTDDGAFLRPSLPPIDPHVADALQEQLTEAADAPTPEVELFVDPPDALEFLAEEEESEVGDVPATAVGVATAVGRLLDALAPGTCAEVVSDPQGPRVRWQFPLGGAVYRIVWDGKGKWAVTVERPPMEGEGEDGAR